MMERLRDGANSIWFKIILSLIILSFVFAGVGSYLASNNEQVAAKVDGQEISQREFEQAYQNERNRMQAQLGENFSNLLGNPQYVQQFRRSVLERMINDVLIQKRAHELGLRVSDQQIRDAIFAMPEFKVDGKFNNEQYNQLLRRSGITPEQFAESLRTDLLRQQFLGAIEGSDFALSGEVNELRMLESQERVIRTLTLNLADFTKKAEASITEEQEKAFYEQNPQQFTRPAQVKVSYVEITGDKLKDSIEVSDADAQAYYNEHKDKFSTPEKRQVSHILITGDSAASKEKAEAILAQLKDGANFAELAKKDSDDKFSAKDGGKLEWFEKGVMDPAFEDAAFALAKPGDLSGVVKSSFGYHIILLDGIEPAKAKPFADVKAEIIADIKSQKAGDEFYAMQTKLAETAFESPDSLDEAAEAVKAKVHSTDFFSEQTAPGVLNNPKVLQALQSPEVREDGMNSDAIEVGPEHVVVVRVDDARDETVLPFKDVEAKVKSLLAQRDGEQQAQKKADEVVAQLRDGKSEQLTKEGYSFSGEQTITRSGPDYQVSQVAFRLAKPQAGKATYGVTRDAKGNVLIVQLDKVIDQDVAKEAADPQFAQQVEQMNAQQDMATTIQTLRETADISTPVLEQSTN
ncbi:peptidylprolyl isomerase [Photobacterium damselae subsp. damselae]|uniref:peptidylprolyl isomerase n=1 Tax=Photobacterium damselae TaxID=38293 RepID=UPI001EEDF158|nr:peptidylprolyl isomerase [Photobacterium damselae]UKA26119.1 peptidylprolyl isomerase [Photobacterium damselae subsp. damselae]